MNGNGAGYSSEGDEDSEIVMSSSPDGGGPPIDAAHVPKKLWRHSSMEVCANLEAKNEAKVLVLYTGTSYATNSINMQKYSIDLLFSLGAI